jgi:hypothetical protein
LPWCAGVPNRIAKSLISLGESVVQYTCGHLLLGASRFFDYIMRGFHVFVLRFSLLESHRYVFIQGGFQMTELMRLTRWIEITKLRLAYAMLHDDASLADRSRTLLATLLAEYYVESTRELDRSQLSFRLVFSSDNTDGHVIDSQNEAA